MKDYYADLTQRLRERLGERAESIIQIALDANNYAPHITDPGIGDQVINAVYSLIVMIDDQHHSSLIDAAVAAQGGEDSDFIVKGIPGERNVPYAVGLFCRTCGSATGDRLTGIYSIGEIELWELVTDAREHQTTVHATVTK